MAEAVCKMEYADGSCDNEPEHIISSHCSNPACSEKQVDVTLCSRDLQRVLMSPRVHCQSCTTGMIIMDAPRPLKGYFDPHPPTEGKKPVR